MLALRGTFVSWETLDSLVSTRYVIDLLVYQTHSTLNKLRDELFDCEIIEYSTSSWEQIGQNILWYMAAWLDWLQLGMCFWGSAYVPRNSGTEMDHPSLISSPWGQLLRSWCLNTKKACWFNSFVCLFVCLFVCSFNWQRARQHHVLHCDMQNLHWMVGAYIYNIMQQSDGLVSLRKMFDIYALPQV